MLAIILCTIFTASSQVFALQQPYHQILNQPPSSALSPIPSLLPSIATDYNPRLDQADSQVLLGVYNQHFGGLKTNSYNCPNSETLQNILSLLRILLSQDESSQFGRVDEKLQVLAWLKKYLENPELEKIPDASRSEAESHIKASPDNESHKSRIEAEFVLKYEIPYLQDTDCKEALIALIQAVNSAQSQLQNYCKLTRKCNLQEPALNTNLRKLPSILTNILSSNARSSNVRNQVLLEKYLKSTDSQIDNNLKINPFQNADYKPILEKDRKHKTLLSDLPALLTQLKEEKKSVDRNMDVAERIPEYNYNLNRPLAFDDPANVYQPSNDVYPSFLSTGNKQINIDSVEVPTLPFQKQNEIIYSYPEGLYKSNIGSEPVDPILNTVLSPETERVKSSLSHRYSVMSNNLNALHYNLENKVVNHNGISRPYVNSYTPFYSPDYPKQDVYGSKLFDSAHLTSVPNLAKLNLAADNNGIVELTYALRRPQMYKPYYYVKYRLPYKAFVSKILNISRNAELRLDPTRLNEEILSVSNVAETSPDLRTFKNNQLSQLVKKSGALVNASILNSHSSKTDELLRTVQDLNTKLNTNEILNLAGMNKETTTILRDDSSDFRDYRLNDARTMTTNLLPSNDLENPVNLVSGLSSNNRNPLINTPGSKPLHFGPLPYLRTTKKPISVLIG